MLVDVVCTLCGKPDKLVYKSQEELDADNLGEYECFKCTMEGLPEDDD